MSNHWTGGQYTLYRVMLGLYLLTHFCQLLPWAAELFSHSGMVTSCHLSPFSRLFPNLLTLTNVPLMALLLNLLGIIGSTGLLLGKKDRLAALLVWYILACFFSCNPLIANPSLPFVGWLLWAHALLPPARFIGDGRPWRMTPSIFLAAWIVMGIAYTYSGLTKLNSPSWVEGSAFSYLLHNPLIRCNVFRNLLLHTPTPLLNLMTWGALGLELLFVGLALFKRIRPLAWVAMVLMHLGILCLVNFADLTLGMLLFHLFTFNPGWVKPKPMEGTLRVYYDGGCGFCHGFVRFVLSENIHRLPFRFSPLQTAAPSTVVVEENGQLLYRSRAVFRVLASLGGMWRIAALLLSLVPTGLCDLIYKGVARVRHRLTPKPDNACPTIAAELREYFIG